MSFVFPFLKNITIFASFHVFGMRRSVMHFVYIFASCFAIVSSPAFSVSMLTWSFPASFPFFIFVSALPLPMPLLVVLLWGMFVLLQLGRCHIILSRILLFFPWSYLVLGSLCLVCPVELSSGFFPRLCVLLTFFKLLHASICSRISSKLCFRISSFAFFFLSYICPHILCGLCGSRSLSFLYASSSELL